MRTEPVTAIRTGPRLPDQGGSVTIPRLVRMDVSHAIRPIARSANRTASRFSAPGHHRGASPSAPAEGCDEPARRRALVCLVTAARSEVRSPETVLGSAVIVAIRVWLPATPR
jgi:hypothetical protein